jgi:hypothetical protein
MVDVQNRVVGVGRGKNKRQAKFEAARKALRVLAPTVFKEAIEDQQDVPKLKDLILEIQQHQILKDKL